jgi:hypothetical protein
VHDYFDILGVAPGARASEIRAACARHAPRPHPDFAAPGRVGPTPVDPDGHQPVLVDVAIDFPNVAALVDRARAAFFRAPVRHRS